MKERTLEAIFNKFSVNTPFIDAISFGSGHINDTYLITTNNEKYILQKLNHQIFEDIERMNQNIIHALSHLYKRQEMLKCQRFRRLEVILSKNGKNHLKDEFGNYWRLMNFISGSSSFDVAEKPDIAFEAARAFGYFQKSLIDLNPDDFFPVIKDFHNLEKRLNSFNAVNELNPQDRNQYAIKEIEFVKSHQYLSFRLTDLLESGQIPLRVTHNDTKINNVLLDENSLKGIAVIDLDTIMPGTILYDFGDMVRTFTSPAAEDEIDLSKVVLRMNIFEALAKGYLSELKSVLTKSEINNMVFGGEIMTFMIGLRFLTDFLQGDVYYKTTRENHNLDRCRTQFTLLSEIEKNKEKLQQIISEI